MHTMHNVYRDVSYIELYATHEFPTSKYMTKSAVQRIL